MRRAVFLDRDNTLMANDGDCGDPAAVVLLPGVGRGIALLREAGFMLVVATNQGGVARGRFTEDDVHAVHARLAALIDDASGIDGAIDCFEYCPFHPEATVARYRGDHPWRKPNPGMVRAVAEELGIDLATSWFIGDAPRDVIAGRRAGCRTVLIQPEPVPSRGVTSAVDDEAIPEFVAPDFLSAVNCVLTADTATRPTPSRRQAHTR